MSLWRRTKTEHGGAKNSSAKEGFWGTRVEAKLTSRKHRRRANLAAIQEQQRSVMPCVIFAHKDDLIVCPTCERDLFRFRRDVFNAEVRSVSFLEPVDGVAEPNAHDLALCPFCAANLLTNDRFKVRRP